MRVPSINSIHRRLTECVGAPSPEVVRANRLNGLATQRNASDFVIFKMCCCCDMQIHDNIPMEQSGQMAFYMLTLLKMSIAPNRRLIKSAFCVNFT